jgi:hypothetical protein
MPTIRITRIDEDLYEEIKKLAAEANRSVGQQVLFMIKDYLAKRHLVSRVKMPGEVLLELLGSWDDKRSAEEIARDIKKARRNSRSLSQGL